MNLALEKGESVTTGGKLRGEAGEVTGVVADVPWEKGMECLVDGGWQLEKWRYCWWLVGLISLAKLWTSGHCLGTRIGAKELVAHHTSIKLFWPQSMAPWTAGITQLHF